MSCVRPRASSRVSIGETGLFLSQEGKVGIPLESKQGNRPPSLDEVGNTGPFLSCGHNLGLQSSGDVNLGEHPELHKGSQASFRISRRNSRLLSGHCRGKGPHLALRGVSLRFSRVAVGSLEFLLSDGGHLREPRVFSLGSQASFQVLRGILGFLRRCCSGIGPHFTFRVKCRGFSRVMAVSLGCLSSCDRDVKIPLIWPQGSQVSFRVSRGSTGLLSSHCRGTWPHLTLRGESCGVSQIATRSFVFSRVATVPPENLSCCLREVRPPFKLRLALRIAFEYLQENRA